MRKSNNLNIIFRSISLLIIISILSCTDDLSRDNPLDINSPYYPEIQILSPNGGEEMALGTSYTISWISSNVEKVNIELLKNNELHEIIGQNIENTDSYIWEISSNINLVHNTYKVRVVSSSNNEIYDQSDVTFSIFELPKINIIHPSLNEKWYLDEIQDITWNSTNITGSVQIHLYKNGLNIHSITSSQNTSPYSWLISSDIYSPGTDYTIKIVSNEDELIYKESGDFELAIKPSLTILNQINNSIEIGQTVELEWESNNISGDVNIFLFQNETPLKPIEIGIPNNQNLYSWNIDNSYSIGNNYTIRIFSDNDNSIYDQSEVFSIVNP